MINKPETQDNKIIRGNEDTQPGETEKSMDVPKSDPEPWTTQHSSTQDEDQSSNFADISRNPALTKHSVPNSRNLITVSDGQESVCPAKAPDTEKLVVAADTHDLVGAPDIEKPLTYDTQDQVKVPSKDNSIMTPETENPVTTPDTPNPVKIHDAQEPERVSETENPIKVPDTQTTVTTTDTNDPVAAPNTENPLTSDAQDKVKLPSKESPVTTLDPENPVTMPDTPYHVVIHGAQDLDKAADTEDPVKVYYTQTTGATTDTQDLVKAPGTENHEHEHGNKGADQDAEKAKEMSDTTQKDSVQQATPKQHDEVQLEHEPILPKECPDTEPEAIGAAAQPDLCEPISHHGEAGNASRNQATLQANQTPDTAAINDALNQPTFVAGGDEPAHSLHAKMEDQHIQSNVGIEADTGVNLSQVAGDPNSRCIQDELGQRPGGVGISDESSQTGSTTIPPQPDESETDEMSQNEGGELPSNKGGEPPQVKGGAPLQGDRDNAEHGRGQEADEYDKGEIVDKGKKAQEIRLHNYCIVHVFPIGIFQ